MEEVQRDVDARRGWDERNIHTFLIISLLLLFLWPSFLPFDVLYLHLMYYIYIWSIICTFPLWSAPLLFVYFSFTSLILVVFLIKFIPPSLSSTLFYLTFFTLPPLRFCYLNYCLLFTFYFFLLLSFLAHSFLSPFFSLLLCTIFSLLSSSYTLMLVSYIFFHSNICFS